MLSILGCIIDEHDLRLVAVACVICALSSVTTVQMLGRAQATKGASRTSWIGAGGVAFGCGVWATHFVAMLAYTPHMPHGFELPLTVASLLFAISGGWIGLLFAVHSGVRAAIASGAILGGTIGVMHFTGMAAFEVPGLVSYSAGNVAASWAAGLIFAPLAMFSLRAGHRVIASVSLLIAVAGLHFLAMTAIDITPDATKVAGVDTASLALAVAAVSLLIVVASLVSAMVGKHLEARAADEAARLHRFADATFEGLFFLDRDIVHDANAVLCEMLGRTLSEVVGSPLAGFFAPGSAGTLTALSSGQGGIAELLLMDAGGEHHVVDVLARPFAAGERSITVLAVRDASERKAAERRIQQLAETDPLTGLANRLCLHKKLAEALTSAFQDRTAVAVFCLDLDRFKMVNDLFGHHAGDSLLVEVSRRLRSLTRQCDTIGRLGGDEFIVVQPHDGTPEVAHALGERLVKALSEPYLIDGRTLEVTASIGIALYPTSALAAELLLRQADLALYAAKEEGRNLYRFFEPAMDSSLRERRELEKDLRLALERGELSVHYQPICHSESLAPVGQEALLRWHHPEHGWISPASFIPLAEEFGTILPIGQWVLETACREAAGWAAPHSVSVNLSPAQFKNQDLAAQIADVLARTGLDPGRLELEITEGALIEDTERAIHVLGAVKSLGVRLALDDFGTGYSSLSYLRRFPFDRLKIDRSFVAELGMDADADAIVACILAMARSLRLAVTAEGVETGLQLQLLREMRCELVQGYHLGRPAPSLEAAVAEDRTPVLA